MKLCWRTHKTLEEFCKTVCTGKIGWNRQRRTDCRNNTMCLECKRRTGGECTGGECMDTAKPEVTVGEKVRV